MSTLNAREWVELYVKEVISEYNPKFKIRPKRDSRLFKILSPLLKLINPSFFTRYTTTLFGTMWVPDNFFDRPFKNALKTTAHEGRHEYDRKRLFFGIFELIYLFPQNLFLPFLALAIFYSWWMLIPAIAFLAPLPAPGRYNLEMKAYAMNRIWNKYVYKFDESSSDDRVVVVLSSLRTYYATWPFKNWIYKDLDKSLDLSDPGYKDTMDFLKRHGLRN